MIFPWEPEPNILPNKELQLRFPQPLSTALSKKKHEKTIQRPVGFCTRIRFLRYFSAMNTRSSQPLLTLTSHNKANTKYHKQELGFCHSSTGREERKRGSRMARPNRSDIHLPPEEEARIEEETREYFDGIVPKRHTKPMRSEYSSLYEDALDSHDQGAIPECVKFQHLENQSTNLVYTGNEPVEEFVETEYYKDLNCVDKQHHTTGTGFIKMESSNGNGFSLVTDSILQDSHPSSKGNPATNEWIPSADTAIQSSGKPNRSDN